MYKYIEINSTIFSLSFFIMFKRIEKYVIKSTNIHALTSDIKYQPCMQNVDIEANNSDILDEIYNIHLPKRSNNNHVSFFSLFQIGLFNISGTKFYMTNLQAQMPCTNDSDSKKITEDENQNNDSNGSMV